MSATWNVFINTEPMLGMMVTKEEAEKWGQHYRNQHKKVFPNGKGCVYLPDVQVLNISHKPFQWRLL